MKLSSKPISSPNRSDLFPPPLMRFIRADAGNRSKIGRSRSSPIFVRKKNVATETQEPSSPKVTCMGQVRTSKTPAAASAVRCRWIRSVLASNRRHCRTFWNRSAAFFRRKREIKPKSSISESEDSEKDEENNGIIDPVFKSSILSPPKNALILTRSRSAPHRSMSYGNRNRSSPKTEDEEQETENRSRSANNSDQFRKNLENSIGDGDSKPANSKIEENSKMNPNLIQRRSRSEPGRIAEKLYRDLNLVEEERSAMATNDSRSLNNFRLND